VEPGREDRGQHNASLGARVDDAVAACESHLKRLLDNHMFACLGGRHRRLEMRAARRTDGDDIDARVFEHRGQFVIGPTSNRLSQPVGSGRIGVEAGDDRRPANVADRPRVEIGDHAATDDAKADCHQILSFTSACVRVNTSWRSPL